MAIIKYELSEKEIPNYILELCEYAEQLNKRKTEEILDRGYCINAGTARVNTMFWLAYCGKRDAVMWLHKNFNASLVYAVIGAAIKNHQKLLFDLINLESEPEFLAKQAIYGAALANNKALIEKIKYQYNIEGGLINNIEGACYAGNEHEVRELMRDLNFLYADKEGFAEMALAGGHIDLARSLYGNFSTNLTAKCLYHNFHPSTLDMFMEDKLITFMPSATNIHKINVILQAIKLAASYGDKLYLDKLIAYFKEANFTEKDKYDDTVIHAVSGAIDGGHLWLINELTALDEISKNLLLCLEDTTKSFFYSISYSWKPEHHFSNEEQTLRYLSLIQNDQLRSYLFKMVEHKSNISTSIYHSANHIAKLMNQYQAPFSTVKTLCTVDKSTRLFSFFFQNRLVDHQDNYGKKIDVDLPEISQEIFYLIFAQLTNTSGHETFVLFRLLQERTMEKLEPIVEVEDTTSFRP